MTIVFPFHQGDILQAKQLLSWIKQLGGCKKHKALLVADAGLSWIPVFEIREIASGSFDSVDIISNQKTVSGWPHGPNSLFESAAMHMLNNGKEPWFWCETDCIPLKPAWADMLQASYETCGKPYMGALVDCNKPGLPPKHLNGNAVYPFSAFELLGEFCKGSKAFDIASAETIVPHAANSFRVQHFWGQKDLPPTFAAEKTPASPINTFTLESINSGAVVFHRNKDGTLVNLLWDTFFPKSRKHSNSNQLILVLPFCKKDISIALKNVQWMKELHPNGYDADVLLSYDSKTPQVQADQIETICRSIFRSVNVHKFPPPKSETWPAAPNYCFQKTASYIQQVIKRPWFWMEADVVPLKKGWLDALRNEYALCNKPFMGSVVEGLGHMNGSGIYPEDFPIRCPNAMKTTSVAWDSVMKDEMIDKCHDASKLIQHFWGMFNGRPHVHLGGAPSFKDPSMFKWIRSDAVVMHRCKDGTLIDALRSQNK